MTPTSELTERARPEAFVRRLRTRLGLHALWDTLLIFVPPLLMLLCAIVYFAQTRGLGFINASIISLTLMGLAVLGVALRYRRLAPQLSKVARLADERAGAKDHFLTMATIDPAVCPEKFLARLRRDTEVYLSRVELRRDFPYKPKRSAGCSSAGSLVMVSLLYFFLPVADTKLLTVSAPERLLEVADRLAQAPRLKDLSRELKTLAAKIDDPKLQLEEKQAAVQELEKKIADRQKKEQEDKNRDLLAQAASALKDAEQQQLAGGSEQQKDQSKGGGNLQSNLPEEGKGERKESQGSGGDGKGEMTAQLNKDPGEGKEAQGNPKEPGQNKQQEQQGRAQGNQPDPNQLGREQSKNKPDKGPGGSKEGSGKNQATEEPPQSAPPAERFYQDGEGPGSIKGKGYITVQLPEEVVAESKGSSAPTKNSKNNRARASIPVSNMPLPSHMPNAPAEKQQMPIEYRGIIR
jgi:hypothetical protein